MSELLDHFAGTALGTVFQTVLLLIQLIVSGLSFAIGQLTGFLQSVMHWQVATNNEVVQVAWAMGRDIANIFFIVGLIIISFATMFRTFGVLRSFHWKSALPRLLAAAIFVNLSLAMSQTVVLVSNHVTGIMGGIIENSGFQLARILKVGTLNNNYHLFLSADRAELADPSSYAAESQAQLLASQNPAFRDFLETCQNEESQVNATFWQRLVDKAPRLALAPALGPIGFVVASVLPTTSIENIDTGGVRKSFQECINEFKVSQTSLVDRAAAFASSILEWTGNTKASTYFFFIITGILNIFMLSMVIISLLSAVVFYMFRVIAIWILLFLSSFAFGFAWLPGGQSLRRWWNVFLGWNVFGPVYLFFLIIGMSFLARQGDLVATLAASEDVGAFGGLFQIVFFYIFAAVVFTGGLTIAYGLSFRGAVESTPILGGAAARFGAFSARQWSQAFGRRVFEATRVPSYFQAARERAAQEWRERRPERILGIPTRIATKEEMLAGARSRLGVRGGAAETQTLRTARIKDTASSLEKGMEDIVRFKDDNVTPDMGAQHTARMDYLKARMNSRNRDEAIAARQLLMKFGELDVPEIKRTQQMLPGGIAQAEFAKTLKTGDIDPLTQFRWATQDPNQDRGEAAEQFFGNILRTPTKFGKLSPVYADPAIDRDRYDEALAAMREAANRIWKPGEDQKAQRARYNAKIRLIRAADTPQKRKLAEDIFA